MLDRVPTYSLGRIPGYLPEYFLLEQVWYLQQGYPGNIPEYDQDNLLHDTLHGADTCLAKVPAEGSVRPGEVVYLLELVCLHHQHGKHDGRGRATRVDTPDIESRLYIEGRAKRQVSRLNHLGGKKKLRYRFAHGAHILTSRTGSPSMNHKFTVQGA